MSKNTYENEQIESIHEYIRNGVFYHEPRRSEAPEGPVEGPAEETLDDIEASDEAFWATYRALDAPQPNAVIDDSDDSDYSSISDDSDDENVA